MLHVDAGRRDLARAVGARRVRQRRLARIHAAAHVGLDRVHARGANLDDHRTRARLRIRHLLQLHHVGGAELVDANGFHTWSSQRSPERLALQSAGSPGSDGARGFQPSAGCYHETSMLEVKLHKTVGVKVGHVQVGGGAPVVVQSMTMTDTADARATAQQCLELAEAGSEMVRITVNLAEAAAAVPEIKQRMLDAGCTAPLIGDFHYNGHLLLTKFPDCATALDKYRINPGNVGTGKRRDEQFSTICKVAVDHNRPLRIGVNGGSLNQELVGSKIHDNTDRSLGRTSEEIINECMVVSAVESTALAID